MPKITLDEHILPEIGSRRLADVTDADDKKLHRSLAAKKYTANKILNPPQQAPAQHAALAAD